MSDRPDYRAFVGPASEYDLTGATQFSLLCALGLREHHRLLDLGCGSLRAGRLFIPYLGRQGYTGLEPNRWLIEEGIGAELGWDAIEVKAPRFVSNDTFDVSGLEPFDFVLAQSIASHTGPKMTRSFLASVKDALKPSGLAAVTFRHGYRDSAAEGWEYPKTVAYRRSTIARWVTGCGLCGRPIGWYHPRQTWWLLARNEAALPPLLLRLQLRGGMLPYRASWSLPSYVRHAATDVRVELARAAPTPVHHTVSRALGLLRSLPHSGGAATRSARKRSGCS